MRLEAERRRLTVQMGYMLRYNPAFELLFRAHREGWLGDLTEINAAMGKLANASLQAELVNHPGHGMFELACHLVDVVVFLLGRPDAVHAFGKPTGFAPAGLPDNQLAVLEYPKSLVTLRCNHGDPFGWPHRRFHAVGTRGAMEIQPLESGRGVLYLSEGRGNFKKGENTFALRLPEGRYQGEFRDLARVLRGERPLAWSATHDIAVHATALRCAGVDP
jgi:predicted dehydrogenase